MATALLPASFWSHTNSPSHDPSYLSGSAGTRDVQYSVDGPYNVRYSSQAVERVVVKNIKGAREARWNKESEERASPLVYLKSAASHSTTSAIGPIRLSRAPMFSVQTSSLGNVRHRLGTILLLGGLEGAASAISRVIRGIYECV